MHIQLSHAQMGKSYNRYLYTVYDIKTKKVIHRYGGANAHHYALKRENIDLNCVGPRVTNMYTNGNQLVNKPPAENSLWQERGVQLYTHKTHRQVYLVFNLRFQKPVPCTTQMLPHPFQ